VLRPRGAEDLRIERLVDRVERRVLVERRNRGDRLEAKASVERAGCR
jgi:hypothetical protein